MAIQEPIQFAYPTQQKLPRQDLTGQRYGLLVVQGFSHRDTKNTYWHCLCDCGNTKVIMGQSLQKKTSKSCGCQQHMRDHMRKDRIGQRFEKLIITATYWTDGIGFAKALCDCGNAWEGEIGHLVQGHTISCGCYRRTAKRKDYTGQQFGMLTVQEVSWQNGEGIAKALCECGGTWVGLTQQLVQGKTTTCGALMHRIKDLTGQRFGRLTVQSFAYIRRNAAYWLCLCDCGNTKIACSNPLQTCRTSSCGCKRKGIGLKSLVGQRFGLLTVQTYAFSRQGNIFWHCQCDCGQTKDIMGQSLKTGNTTSCGLNIHSINDLAGKRFGLLTVVRLDHVEKYGAAWECQCDCGQIRVVLSTYLVRNATRHCGCLTPVRSEQYKKEMARLNQHKRRTRIRELPHLFTIEDLDFLLQYWNFACAICGEEDGSFFYFIALDHWIPIANQTCPGTVPWNILSLCHGKKNSQGLKTHAPCNTSKGARDPLAWLVTKLGPRRAKAKLREIEAYFALTKERNADAS